MHFYAEKNGIENLEWFSLKRDFSFATKYIYLIGGRGYGKTYSVKTYIFQNFVKKKKKFAWVRTTLTALENIMSTEQFFGRMENLEQIGITKCKVIGDKIYINDELAGYFFAVSTFYNQKGSDYDVDTIVWDEFMRAKGERPLPNRREKFMDLVESIGRENASRVICMSNSTSQYDEVLSFFNVKLKDYGVYLYRDKNALIHYIQSSEKYKQRKMQSLSGLGMSNAQKDFAFSNKFTEYDDYETLSKSKYMYTLKLGDTQYISFYSHDRGLYVNDKIPKDPVMYCIDNIYVNNKIQKLSSKNLLFLKTLYGSGLCVFNTGYSRGMFQAILN